MSKITFADKVALNENSGIADINKVKNTDINEIKSVVNDNDDEVQGIIAGNVYSTTKVDTGKIWIDGKKIYRVYMEFDVSSTGTITLDHNLGIETVTDISAICTVSGQTPSSHGYRPMPQSTSGNWFGINAITTNQISFIANGWQNNKAYITLEYTEES